MTFDRMTVRRHMLRLAQTGDAVHVPGPFDQIEKEAQSFARSRRMQITISQHQDGATIERLADKVRGQHAYTEIESLAPGQSVVLDVPALSHQRVRVAASQFSKKTGATYRCMADGDTIRVIRTDGTDKPIEVPTRATKYDLDRLATEPRITFNVPPTEHHKVRSACSFKSKQTGWTIRCRLQDDGTMLVYRNDAGAPAADSSLSTITHTQ